MVNHACDWFPGVLTGHRVYCREEGAYLKLRHQALDLARQGEPALGTYWSVGENRKRLKPCRLEKL